jgi:uncharacterized protein YodC (DUF2158 family)
MSELKVGSTARLKSGGPLMTIAEIDGNEAYCEWFDKAGEHQARRFLLSSLDEDDGGPVIA